MFVTSFNRVEDLSAIREMVAHVGAGELVTVAEEGYLQATLLPVIWTGDRVLAHMARANPHWSQITDGAPALLICDGAQAYISPSWYPSKAEHGKVVPTWNYQSVQIRGRIHVHHDPEWLRAQVSALTDHHEHHRDHPWHVTDAPDTFIDSQLRGIVGIEIDVEHVDGKAKLSQNKNEADEAGVITGLQHEPATGGAAEIASRMGCSQPG